MKFHKTSHLVFALLLMAGALASMPASSVRAASLVVNTLTDENDGSCVDGDCSLRDAIQVASDGDVITFSVTGTITLTMGQISISGINLTITGPGTGQLTVSGNNASRIFYVSGASNTVSISGMTLTNGYVVDAAGGAISGDNIQLLVLDQTVIQNNYADSSSGFPRGGGIALSNGSLTVTNSTISGNTSEWAGGGIGMMNNTTLTMTNVIVDDNHAVIGWGGESKGGGVAFESAGNPSILTNVTISNNTAATYGGGLYVESSEVTLNGSAVSGNASTNHGGGAYVGTSTVNIYNSVLSMNQTGDDGGGLYATNSAIDISGSTFNDNFTTGASVSHGGAIYNQAASSDSTITIRNSTLSENTANNGAGGGIYNIAFGGNVSNSALVDVYNSTIAENTADGSYTGGGLFASTGTGAESSSITLSNSIVYGNLLDGVNTGENCNVSNSAVILTDANNLLENQASDCPAGGSDVTDTVALSAIMNALADNGGPTQTRALITGSPAIDAGDATTCAHPPVNNLDQRGVTRPRDGNGDMIAACDIGAYELILSLTVMLQSNGTLDGWILESSEISGTGGTMDSTATTFLLGDDASDKQYRGILHFDTSALPDNAIITSAVLQIRRHSTVGTNPFTILGALRADLRKGSFGTSTLQITDFKVNANKNNVVAFNTTPVGNWYTGTFSAIGRYYINRTGTTQFKIYFTLDDNDDMGADYLRFFSGNAGATARPRLVIQYYVP